MNWLNHLLNSFYTAQWHVTRTQAIYYREIVGNVFGLASALFGLSRKVWAWPVGIVGNALLLTVFLGQALGHGQGTPLYGQASRQVFFVIVSVYGWWRWRRNRGSGDAPAVTPRWATSRERAIVFPAALAAVVMCFLLFQQIGNGPYFKPAWWYYLADSWIFVGSGLATYAMARGWIEFWLCWIAVDVVGVPELLHFHYYPSATMYAIYAGFVLWGYVVWSRISRAERAVTVTDPALETVA